MFSGRNIFKKLLSSGSPESPGICKQMELILSLKKQSVKTVVIVSHDLDEVTEYCNKITVFRGGKVVCCDTPKNVFTSLEKVKEYGLGLPITANCALKLKEIGVNIDTDFKADNFISAISETYKKSR